MTTIEFDDEIYWVPYSQLRVSDKNVRKKRDPKELQIPQLAAQIKAETLLQNLVTTFGEGGKFVVVNGKKTPKGPLEIVDGYRRYLSIGMNAAELLLDLDQLVPVKIRPPDHAVSASLTAAFGQLPLHPVEQFDAFKALVDEGKSVVDIAAAFGLVEKAVSQRLLLAKVAPQILKAFREEEISLEVLQAFTVNDDQKRQLKAFQGIPSYLSDAQAAKHVRTHLTDKEMSLRNEPLARLVGVEAYQAAGGQVRSDLFNEDTYFADPALIRKLANDRVAELEPRVRSEGWSWVEVKLERVPLYAFAQRKPKVAQTTPEQDRELASIKTKLASVGKRIAKLRQDEPDDDESPEYAAWLATYEGPRAEHQELTEREEQIQADRSTWSARTLKEAGVVICLDHEGNLKINRGLVDPKTMKRIEKEKKKAAAVTAGGPVETVEISDSLHQRLTAHRSAVIRRKLQLDLKAMLAVLAHSLTGHTFGRSNWKANLTEIGAPPQDKAHATAGVDMDEYVSHLNLSLDRSELIREMPEDEKDALVWLLEQSEDYLLKLISACVATSFNGIYGKSGWKVPERHALTEVLVEYLDIDMREHWQATVNTYLGHVPKPLIIQAVTEAKGAAAAKDLTTMPKGAAAEAAELHLDDEEWVPELFRRVLTKPKEISQEEAVAHIHSLLEAKRARDSQPSSWPATPEASPIADQAKPILKAPPVTKVAGKKAAVKKVAGKKAAKA
jgi:ParB family chromosome partitioning protein